MAVMRVSASEFRVKMKDLANSIAREQHRVIVTRHGGEIFVAVSEEDFEFLEKHKSRPTPRPVPEPEVIDPVFERIDHPDRMETADIEYIYEKTHGCEDQDLKDWRVKAWIVLKGRCRKPERMPWDSSLPREGAGAHAEGGGDPVPIGSEAVIAPVGELPQPRNPKRHSE
jgi:prevent-host-death family protein